MARAATEVEGVSTPLDNRSDAFDPPAEDRSKAQGPSSKAEPADVSARVSALASPLTPSPGQWYSLDKVKLAVLDAGADRLGVLSPGSKFGVYWVGPCIGEGGMGRVYQAEHAGLRRQVALKVLIDGFARNPAGRDRFLREARIAAAIKHPNVVNIFDVGVHEDIPYLVMELLEGQDLEKLLGIRRSLDEGLIVDIMVPVVAGLVAVHDAGIAHRDLKPGNIFLARGRFYELEPKLLDFGMSQAQGRDQLKRTTSRTVIGTPMYVAPEGLQGGKMTPLSDQYSLGVVMYECATGLPPFAAPTFAELSEVIAAGQYTPPSRHKPEMSKRLARIIERAMSLEPEQRFKDLREMGRELLLLAGQRTRITWGLSFESVKDNPASRPGARVSGGRIRSGRSVALALFAIAQSLVLSAVLLAWLSGRVAFDSSGRTPLAAPRGQPVAVEPVAVLPPLAPAAGASAPSAADRASIGRAEAPREGATAAGLDDTRMAVAGDAPAGRAISEASGVERNPRGAAPAGRRSSNAAPKPAPAWALPAAPSSSSAGDSRELGVGANGAPILD
jgi:eukaryotic-like serine/threonine-protein kinase